MQCDEMRDETVGRNYKTVIDIFRDTLPSFSQEVERISTLIRKEEVKRDERIMRLKMTAAETFIFDHFTNAKLRKFVMRKYTMEKHEDVERRFFRGSFRYEGSTIKVYRKNGAPFCVSIMPDMYVALTVDGLIEGSVKI